MFDIIHFILKYFNVHYFSEKWMETFKSNFFNTPKTNYKDYNLKTYCIVIYPEFH